jgi:hypothetical protein
VWEQNLSVIVYIFENSLRLAIDFFESEIQ